jgi:hypothetical protein
MVNHHQLPKFVICCQKYNSATNELMQLNRTKDINEQDATINRRWRICKLGEGQIINFNILFKVMESASLNLFLPEELELLVAGSPDLDVNALGANTK